MKPSPSRPSPPSAATLGVIRLAILLGVLAFGAVVWYLQRRPEWSPAPGLDRDTIFYVGIAVWGISAAGLVLLRARWLRETDPRRRTLLMVAAWAVGEVPAFWGGVYFLLTGDPQRYFTGLMFLVVAFLLLPVRPRS